MRAARWHDWQFEWMPTSVVTVRSGVTSPLRSVSRYGLKQSQGVPPGWSTGVLTTFAVHMSKWLNGARVRSGGACASGGSEAGLRASGAHQNDCHVQFVVSRVDAC